MFEARRSVAASSEGGSPPTTANRAAAMLNWHPCDEKPGGVDDYTFFLLADRNLLFRAGCCVPFRRRRNVATLPFPSGQSTFQPTIMGAAIRFSIMHHFICTRCPRRSRAGAIPRVRYLQGALAPCPWRSARQGAWYPDPQPEYSSGRAA